MGIILLADIAKKITFTDSAGWDLFHDVYIFMANMRKKTSWTVHVFGYWSAFSPGKKGEWIALSDKTFEY